MRKTCENAENAATSQQVATQQLFMELTTPIKIT
jgi:hypothetical protein